MSAGKQQRANLDIYLVAVIMVLVLTIGGAMWIIGKSLDVRLDELSVRVTSQTGQIRSELFEMRKDLEQLTAAAQYFADYMAPTTAMVPRAACSR